MTWQILGESVIGASHRRNNKPNQDAWESFQADNFACVAVADGHGSSKHIYSDTGARLAVQVAVRLLKDFAMQSGDVRQIKLAADYLPRALVQAWRLAVDEEDHEKTELKQRYSAYGSTLLAMLITENYVLYLQIGDGDVVVAHQDGRLHRPLLKNAGLIANETYSLCEENAVNRMELSLRFFDFSPEPRLIFLATDGYANSFASEADFYQAVQDFQSQCVLHGVDKVKACLPDWLIETTEQGSGDDVTVAIFLNAGVDG